MKRLLAVLLGFCLGITAAAAEQQRPADAPPLVDAKKAVTVTWTLQDQVWDFSKILSVYEPVKGQFDPLTHEAIWTLQLIKDLQDGEATLHNRTDKSPFKPVLLNAERTVIAPDARVRMTEVSGKMGDTVLIVVQLPEAEALANVKTIRIERRTNVAFDTQPK